MKMKKTIQMTFLFTIFCLAMPKNSIAYVGYSAADHSTNVAISKNVRDVKKMKSDLKKYCVKKYDVKKCKKYCAKAKAKKSGYYKKYCKKLKAKTKKKTTTIVVQKKNKIQVVAIKNKRNLQIVNNQDGTRFKKEVFKNKKIDSLYDSSGSILYKETVEINNFDKSENIKKEFFKENEQKIKEKNEIYDKNKNLIEEIVININENDEKVVSHKIFGEKLNENKIKINKEKSISFFIEKNNNENKVALNLKNDEVDIYFKKYNNEDASKNKKKARIKIQNNKFIILDSNYSVFGKQSVVIGNKSGKIYIDSKNEKLEIVIMPKDIVKKIKKTDSLDIIESKELIKVDDVAGYKFTGVKFKNFLGLFMIEKKVELVYNAQDGSLIKTNESILEKILKNMKNFKIRK